MRWSACWARSRAAVSSSCAARAATAAMASSWRATCSAAGRGSPRGSWDGRARFRGMHGSTWTRCGEPDESVVRGLRRRTPASGARRGRRRRRRAPRDRRARAGHGPGRRRDRGHQRRRAASVRARPALGTPVRRRGARRTGGTGPGDGDLRASQARPRVAVRDGALGPGGGRRSGRAPGVARGRHPERPSSRLPTCAPPCRFDWSMPTRGATGISWWSRAPSAGPARRRSPVSAPCAQERAS